jgi:pimeloyl-ACP methyl ester carboxylesterase
MPRQPSLRMILIASGPLLCAAITLGACQLSSIAAGGLLHPARRQSLPSRPANCDEREFTGEGVRLRGWHCRAEGAKRGTIVYLHGTADNRGSSVGLIRRVAPMGLDVVAYDSRGHGASEGDVCTYGYFEKQDLRRVIDALAPGPIVLLGASLGAAVALQEAAGDPRVSGVIAVEVFSDLRTIAHERAPFFVSDGTIRRAFQLAESRGHFEIDQVSPVNAAKSVWAPVLVIHGANDRDTPPAHSQRVHAALAGPKRLILVERAGHNGSLGDPAVWVEIDKWLQDLMTRAAAR